MKRFVFFLTFISVAALGRDLHCTGTGTAKALKSFVIQDFFGKAHSNELDGYLLDGKVFNRPSVEYFITNECDNGFTFKFPHRAWRRLALGLRSTITAEVDYGYPGHVGEDEVMEGRETVRCVIR